MQIGKKKVLPPNLSLSLNKRTFCITDEDPCSSLSLSLFKARIKMEVYKRQVKLVEIFSLFFQGKKEGKSRFASTYYVVVLSC